MDLERFQEFTIQAAARHEAEIAEIRESIRSLTNTVDRLVDNQVFLQESLDLLTRKLIEENDLLTRKVIEESDQRQRDYERSQAELQELRRIVFRHVTDPNAHGPT